MQQQGETEAENKTVQCKHPLLRIIYYRHNEFCNKLSLLSLVYGPLVKSKTTGFIYGYLHWT